MSEYQYYEFQAIDRSLTAEEMNELRRYSSRARITPTSFTVDYSWSDFKGDKDAWMEKYFDAFLYLSNWGTHVLKLRLPSKLLDPSTVRQYCGGDSAFVREKNGKVILTLVSEDEEGREWVEGNDQLSSMISVRAEEKARHEREAAVSRKKHLDTLVGKEPGLWTKVDTLIAEKQAKSYDLALKILIDLRDLAARADGGEFRLRIEAVRQEHARKPAFIERLRKAGL